MKRSLLVLLLVFAALLVGAKLRYSGKAPVKLPAIECNADLWKHVYLPQRLRVLEACTVVEGRVVSVHRAADGDLHIGLDPDQKSALNLINIFHARRTLIVEAVCDHPSDEKEAQSSCAGFTSAIAVPRKGDRVRVTGAYVTDIDNSWNEIHPATKIDVIP